MPSPPPTARLALRGCALAASAALLLPGCGGDSAATADSAAATRARTEASAKVGAAPAGCPRQVDAFVAALKSLRRQLAVGLSYEQYATRVKALRKTYGGLPIHRLAIGCVNATGAPAEAAFNEYIDAANAWGECLADAACSTAAIEPVLQRKWRLASRLLSEAR